MMEADFFAWWQLGYTLGAAVVVIVAVLLIAILLVARNIERLAGTALAVAGDIIGNTRPIWALGDANQLTAALVKTVRGIEESTVAIAHALAPAGGERGRS